LKAQVHVAKEHQKNTYRELHNERHACQRAVKRKSVLDEKIAELRTEQQTKIMQMKELEKEKKLAADHVAKVIKANESLQNKIPNTLKSCESRLVFSHEKLKQSQAKLKGSKGEIYNLKRKIGRAVQTKENAVKRAKAKVLKESTTLYLLKKGVYSEETRNLVRILVEANVSNENIMGVIEAVLATAGITAVG
jgi:chromosome segregation ATPase